MFMVAQTGDKDAWHDWHGRREYRRIGSRILAISVKPLCQMIFKRLAPRAILP